MMAITERGASTRGLQTAVLVTAMVGLALAVFLVSHTRPAPGALVHAGRVADVVAPAAASSNWAGYAVTSATSTAVSYSSVTGTWTVPVATCGPSDAGAASAVWVGLGGYSLTSQALEQTGTDSDCDQGGPSYYAWYELVPSSPVTLSAKVLPGNVITTSVNIIPSTTGGQPTVELQVKNRTRRWTVTKKIVPSVLDTSSAEWIAEAPSNCSGPVCNPVPLANFGSVTIGNIATIGDGQPSTLTNPSWTVYPILLVPSTHSHGFFPGVDRFGGSPGSTAGASPGGISTDGRSFAVSWLADATGQ